MSNTQPEGTLELSREEMRTKTFGFAAFRQAVTWAFTLAELAEEILHESTCWEVVTPAQMGIVTFRFVPGGQTRTLVEVDAINQRIVDLMIADGFAMISSTSLRGHIFLRLCTINPRTTEEDIRETIRKLESFGRQLSVQYDRY